MNTLTFAGPSRFLLLSVAAILLPRLVGAQPVLSVTPSGSTNPIVVEANVGTNAPSQTVQVRNDGTRALKWTIGPLNPAPANWQLSVSPTSGGNASTLILTFTTSALSAGTYNTSFEVRSTTAVSGSPATVYVQVKMVGSAQPPPPPPPPGADITVNPTTAAVGSAVTVSFSGIPNPTSRDWISLAPAGSSVQSYLDWKYASSCTQTPGTARASGSCSFTAPSTAGNYEFRLLPNDQFTLLDSVTLTVSWSTTPPPPPPPPPPSSGVGPQSTITCPAGAVDIWPGVTIQNVVNSYGGNTTFCLRAGVHSLSSSIVPQTGNTFVGEYGAILDGTGWSTIDETQAAFRSHESPPQQRIDYVTIRNLVIRNMPQRGIHAYYSVSDNWTIEYNDISTVNSPSTWTCCAGVGIVFPSYSIIRNNIIHDNIYAGFMGPYAHHSTLDSNEIAYNGWEQRVRESNNVTFRNNFIHHNAGAGIWYDSNNTGALIEGNRVEDNGWIAIDYEISTDGIIRNNTIRRNATAAVFIATSKNVQIYNNTLEDNFREIVYFVTCAAVGGGSIGFDLANNTAHHNTITVGTQSGALANVFSYYRADNSCSATQLEAYKNGSKNLTFSNNTYDVPSPATGLYWHYFDALKSWSEWQALGHDTTSTVK